MAQSLRVLIMVDSLQNAELLLAELRCNGYELDWEQVTDVDAVTAALDRHGWDVVLADARLPGLDAPALLKLLRTRQLDVPLIVVSAIAGDEVVEAALQAGAQGSLTYDCLHWLVPLVERELGDVQDRQARRQTQEALRESAERYRALFENASDAIFVADAQTGRILDANQRACMLVGRSQAELRTMHHVELYPPEYAAEYAEMFVAHANQSSHQSFDALVRHREGNDIPVEISADAILIDGKPAVLGIFRDASAREQIANRDLIERRRAEDAARQLSALNELGLALAETLELAQVYRIAYQRVSRLTDTDGFAITMYTPATRSLRPAYVVSDGEPVDVSIFPPIVFTGNASGGRARAVLQREPEIIRLHRSPTQSTVVVGQQPLSSAYIPMIVKGVWPGRGRVVGAGRQPDRPGDRERAAL
jgi:PAS domain S-box-containing protein